MKVATAFSTATSPDRALQEAFAAVSQELGATPELIVVSYSEAYEAQALARAVSELPPSVNVHGASSCLGAMTAQGGQLAGGPLLAMLALSDPEGGYGVGSADLGSQPRAAGALATQRAIAAAARPGENPSLIWLSAAPGAEESILLGIADVVGPNVPVFGGSAADNAIKGAWSQIERGGAHAQGVVVAVLYPSGELSHAFSSGYEPTGARGRITAAGPRCIVEIEGRPAALWYDEKAEGAIHSKLGGGDILAETTLHPLGRRVATIAGVDQYLLIHPSGVDAQQGLTVFADVAVGDELVLMSGSKQTLVARIRSVVEAARAAAPHGFVPAGALVIYCAGCMLAVRDEIEQVVTGLRETLGGAPFLGAFTFGEQGCITRGTNGHGNLGMSIVLLGA